MVNLSPSKFIFEYCHLTDVFCALMFKAYSFNAINGNQFKHDNKISISLLKSDQINSYFCLNSENSEIIYDYKSSAYSHT
jgi:hypothetical protein